MIEPKHISLIFVILCAISAVLCAYDLSTELEPKGKLRVRLDYNLASSWPTDYPLDKDPQPPRTWFFSSHLTFKESVDNIEDEQLWQMAVDGYKEAIEEATRYIILASSMKGVMSFSYAMKDTPVSKTLEKCETLWKKAGNPKKKWKNMIQGKCGELMAAQIYYSIGGKDLEEQKHRVGTVAWNREAKGPIPRAPCGEPAEKKWGCDLFVKKHPMTYLDVNLQLKTYVPDFLDSSKAFPFRFSAHPSPLFAH
ncbi:hypothetical protein BBP40_005881 [Aspergillus hancockii]|nr:hypothetical protein BBP40_005881 [Aspergillus hancockii]